MAISPGEPIFLTYDLRGLESVKIKLVKNKDES